MFPVPWFVVALYLAAYAVAGMVIGVVTGWLVSRLARTSRKRLLKDASLGSSGFLAGFIGCIFMGWARNTITYRFGGQHTEVSSTMNTYQHPERMALAIAILLPLFHGLYRRRKLDSASLM
jgi:MFS family permease